MTHCFVSRPLLGLLDISQNIALPYGIWRRVEDSNPQGTIADPHVGFLDRCDSRYTNSPCRGLQAAPIRRHGLWFSSIAAIFQTSPQSSVCCPKPPHAAAAHQHTPFPSWSHQQDLNPQPSDYKSAAQPIVL